MVFGETISKIISGESEIILDHSILDPQWIQAQTILFESVLTKERSYANDRHLSEFKVFVNLFKYDDPIAKALEIEALRNTDIYFYPHSDGDAMKNLYDEEVEYNVTNIEYYPLSVLASEDVCVITLSPIQPIRLFASGVSGNGYGTAYGANYGGGL